MKRILFAALVIAALQTNISAAGKRRRVSESDESSDPRKSATALVEGDERETVDRRRPVKKRVQQEGKGSVAGIEWLRAEIKATQEATNAMTIATLQAQIAAAKASKKEAEEAVSKIEVATTASSAKTGRGVFAYSASLFGSMFDTVASGFGWGRGSDAGLVGTSVGVAGAPLSIGLENNGNMCYQNAVMQAVHKCVPLRDALRNGFDVKKASLAVGMQMPDYVEHFFATQAGLSGAVTPYNPVEFCTALQAVAPYFKVGVQRDSSEILQILWDRLQAAGVIPIARGNADGFHGIAQQDQLVCADCGLSRRSPMRPDCTFALSLAIPAGVAAHSVAELLAHYSAEEVMTGDEAVACDTCQRNTTQRKTGYFAIHPAQQFMMIQVKRFAYVPATGSRTKRSNPVIFPEDGIILIPDSAGVAHRFRVASVVIHSGTANGGHYWTVTPHGIYNDSIVTPDGGAAMRELLTTGVQRTFGTGYLYFLERV